MALQRVPNALLYAVDINWADAGGTTLDATGESTALIGYVALENGSASTKTISAAGGGAIYWRLGTVTFSDAGSTFDVGIQDVASTGLEDGSYDVQVSLVGGTDVLSANAFAGHAMDAGSKTLTHGQLIAIVWHFTARAGSDSIVVDRVSNEGAAATIPYTTVDIGAHAKQNPASPFPWAMIVFDDGTVGWIMGMGAPPYGRASVAYGTGSAHDEHIVTFTPAFTCEIDGVGVDLSDVDATDTFEMKLYSDPYGTPSTVLTLTPDSDQTAQSANAFSFGMFSITPTTLTAGVTYGVSVLATSVGTVAMGYYDLGSGFEKIKRMSAFGSTLKLGRRDGSSGAFEVVDEDFMPPLFMRVSKLDDGAGSGGGGGSVFGAVGGVIA